MPFIRQPFVRYSLLVGFICLTGCSNNPVIKTPVGWYHNFEGGIVSQPRLPVPGNDQSYPYVGLTPTHGPVLPSQDLRNQITESLLKDRTLSDWKNTVASFEIPKVPEAPQQNVKNDSTTQPQQKPNDEPAKTEQNNQKPEENSANFDAAGQTPPPIIVTQPPAQPPKTETVKPPAQPQKIDKKPEEVKKAPPEPVVMPELRTQIDNQTIVLPEIPVSPPKPSNFPGFNIPSDANLPPPFQPSSLPLEAPKGELITFPIDSDTPNPKQEGIINSLAWQRHDRTIFVHGYGNASSISPEAQSKALSLALLRAKTVAKMLIAHNVPESSIIIRAHAIGHGVRVLMDE